jgi:adenylate cyclase
LQKEVPPPQGQVALVFTDIKNSTSLWENHPDAMRAAIAIHNALMRRSLRMFYGYEVKTEGDAFMVAFRTVNEALRWCLDIQVKLLDCDWPTELIETNDCKPVYGENNELLYRGLSVRMGIHYGTPICQPDPTTRRMDYFGGFVARTSRICGCADGGQIFISQQVMEIYNEKLEEEVAYEIEPEILEIGEKSLKGISTPEFLYVVYPRIVAARFHSVETKPNATMRSTNSGKKDIMPLI